MQNEVKHTETCRNIRDVLGLVKQVTKHKK